jgi:hypothetical protein
MQNATYSYVEFDVDKTATVWVATTHSFATKYRLRLHG